MEQFDEGMVVAVDEPEADAAELDAEITLLREQLLTDPNLVDAFVAEYPNGATLEQVGVIFGLTYERVRQIEKEAQVKLLNALEAPKVRQEVVSRDAARAARSVIRRVSKFYNLAQQDLVGDSQNNKVANARHIAMAICVQRGLTSVEVGLVFRRDHSTVLAGVRKVKDLYEAFAYVRAMFQLLA